ncbi:MAG TPA: hypothetical protein VHA06_14995 [Candidatus Angelobacter sp.]|jgi:hypothetical protein|nr:hypothetical protein [Candidatus Angelobacter sp.]
MLLTLPVAPHRVSTPLGFLAEQEQLIFQWPARAEDRAAWHNTAKILKKKMAVTIRFSAERLSRLTNDSELYFALCEAKSTAMAAHGLAMQIQYMGGIMGANKFTAKTTALRVQCDNLKSSIIQIFALLDESGLVARVDRAM